MDLLTLVGVVIGAVVIHFLTHDLYASAPRFAERVTRQAVARLPMSLRTRYEEEWLAHLRDCDGAFAKLLHAFQCWLCARTLGPIHQSRRSVFQVNGRDVEMSLIRAAYVVACMWHVFKDEDDERKKTLLSAFSSITDSVAFDPKAVDPTELRALAGALEQALHRPVNVSIKTPGS